MDQNPGRPLRETLRDRRIGRRDLLRNMMYVVVGGAAFSTWGCTTGQGQPTATPSPQPTAPSLTAAPTPTTVAAMATPALVPVPGARSPLSVPEGDPALDTADVTFPNEGTTLLAYQAKPQGNGPFPALLVCHENRGLTPHLRDVARRFAKQGYATLAVDLLSRQGGTGKFADEQQVIEAIGKLPPDQNVSDFQAGFRYLASQPFVDKNRIGMIGYCFGGGVTWRTVTKLPELKSAAAYYGPAPDLADVPNIQAAVFGVYAAEDPRITVSREPLENALKENNKTYQMKTYPGVRHAFHNDTGAAYSEEQALQVWKDTLDWFQRYLKG